MKLRILEHGLGLSRNYIPLEFALEADFRALCAHIFTTPSFLEKVSCHHGLDLIQERPKCGYLVIEIESRLDAIDAASEVGRYSRPRVLILLGVLSYLTGNPFTVHQIIRIYSTKLPVDQLITPQVEVSTFLVEGRDQSQDLLKLLHLLNSEDLQTRYLAASLLDRWRKALYLWEESEVQLFDDEALLAFFHTLELLASHYQKKLRDEGEYKIRQFLTDFLEGTLKFRGANLEQSKAEKSRQIRALFLTDEQIPVSSKICYCLDQLGMLDAKTQALVANLVKARNAIAHGRQVYQEEFIWPLPPFFPLDRDSYQHIREIEVLSARAIANHMGLNAWREEWAVVHNQLDPPADIVKSFVSQRLYQQVSTQQFLVGDHEGICLSSVVNLFLSGKLQFSQLEESLRKALLEAQLTEENASQMFLAAVLLADSQDKELSDRCKFIVEEVHSQDWIGYTNVKDVLRYLEYSGFYPMWLRSWIENEGHLQRRRRLQE